MTRTISREAADALRAATADERSVTLAPGQLARPVYVEVNKVLERIAGGGKWNRQAKAHLFTQDPRPALAELIGTDGSDDTIVMPDDQAKLASFWRTPPAVVDRMIELAGIAGLSHNAWVLEPSAGDGAIADAVRRCHPLVNLLCIETDRQRAAVLRDHGHAVFTDPFETWACHGWKTAPRNGFAAVVMNPPFTLPGNATAWVDHIDGALNAIRPGGRLVAVAPVSYVERVQHRKIAALRARLSGLGATWEPLDDDAFKESGTGVRTGLIAARVS